MTLSPGTRPLLDQSALDLHGTPWRVEVLDEAPSTNAVLAARAREGAAEGLVVVAEHQTSGRGRLDRSWESPARAGLTFSVLVRPAAVPPERWAWLPLLTGVAVVDGIAAAGGPQCTLKWPNDVMCEGRKLGGLLVERVDSASGPWAVIGIGLNVSTTAEELPVPEATSLAIEGAAVDRTAVLGAVLRSLAEEYAAWSEVAGAAHTGLHQEYQDRCSTLGRQVRALLPSGETVEGTAEGIAEDGALVVATDEGRVLVRAGDVVHVRPGHEPG